MTEQENTAPGAAFGSYVRRYRGHFRPGADGQRFGTYCRGLLSDLPHKSTEPITLAAETAGRTLREFLATPPPPATPSKGN